MSFSVTFNGNTIPSFVKVKTVDFTVLPDISHSFKQVAGGQGLLETGTTIGGKKLEMKIAIIPDSGKSLTDMARELAYWLKGNEYKTCSLIISDESAMTYQAKASESVDISDILFAGEGTLTFIVPSGIAKSSVAVSITVSTNISITYNGTAPSYPVFTWTAPALTGATLNLTCTETGKTLSITGTFLANDVITLDCKNKCIKRNGTVEMTLLNLGSDWIKLPTRGTYTITKNQSGTYTCTTDNNWL